MLLLILVLLNSFHLISAHSIGSPICKMSPSVIEQMNSLTFMGQFQPQPSSYKIEIVLNSTTLGAGMATYITVLGEFKGMLLYGESHGNTIGTFSLEDTVALDATYSRETGTSDSFTGGYFPSGKYQHVSKCPEKSTLTHSTNDLKKQTKFLWIAPDDFVDQVVFTGVFVNEDGYIQVQSDVVKATSNSTLVVDPVIDSTDNSTANQYEQNGSRRAVSSSHWILIFSVFMFFLAL